MTLNGVIDVIVRFCVIVTNSVSLGANYAKVLQDRSIPSATKM